MHTEQIIIIGAGPAGMAATLQLRRFGLDPLLLEKHQLGGLLNNANLVENYEFEETVGTLRCKGRVEVVGCPIRPSLSILPVATGLPSVSVTSTW